MEKPPVHSQEDITEPHYIDSAPPPRMGRPPLEGQSFTARMEIILPRTLLDTFHADCVANKMSASHVVRNLMMKHLGMKL